MLNAQVVTSTQYKQAIFSKNDLLQLFVDVEEEGECFFFKQNLAESFDQYCLSSTPDLDLLVISENISDRYFSLSMIKQARAHGGFSREKVVLFGISDNKYGFSHCVVFPNTYHGMFKGKFENKRNNLFLCVPIHRCEFAGDESADEFKEMNLRTIPVFRWDRKIHPKIRIYFDNPETDTGTDEDGVVVKYPTLLNELDNLNGVSGGFIEITNYAGAVVEVLSRERGAFTLILNRRDEETMHLSELVGKLNSFLYTA